MSKHQVGKTSDLAPGKASLVGAGDKKIAVFNLDGRFFAIDDMCSHVGGPLSEGEISGTTVSCPWHGANFDITTGKCLGGPARRDQGSYPVEEREGFLYIEVP